LDYKTDPPFADYACGLMAYQHTPDYLRNDPELLQEFPPRRRLSQAEAKRLLAKFA
jgi:hypothetical protein